MGTSEADLKRFGGYVQRLIEGRNLSRHEAYSLFGEILQARQPDLHQGAFLAALAAKGETAEEVAGVWQAIVEFDTVSVSIEGDGYLVENSGTGMDSLKTFNVSSAAGIVAAACGARLARHGARAITSLRGTVDILESVGLDVECDVGVVKRSIEDVGIGLFNGMSSRVHPAGLGRILSQIRFGSTLNMAASLANPARPTAALRGVFSEALLTPVMDVMQGIGYERAIVVYGKDDRHEGGMDEISISGETVVRSFGAGLSDTARLRPEDVGLKTARYETIAASPDSDAASTRFVQVLAGQGHSACVDFTCLNAAGILVAAGIRDSIENGLAACAEAVHDGSAIRKLQQWVATQTRDRAASESRLAQVLDQAGVR
jgi:anthranilate phosphoribosyltransferase